MKLTAYTAAAILAYCAAAAPAPNSTTTEKSAALPTEPIALSIAPPGLLKPEITKKINTTHSGAGSLEDFPTIVENHHGNKTAKPHHPVFRPFGHGGHGPVIQRPRPEHHHNTTVDKREFHPLTGGPFHHNTTFPDIFKHRFNITHSSSMKNTTATLPTIEEVEEEDEDDDEFSVSFRRTTSDEKSGKCFADSHSKRFIEHEHEQEHTVIDVCDTDTKEENSKNGDTISSKSRTHIGTVHSDVVGESHLDFNDGANSPEGITGLADLPPELREHYLDELAKLNSTKRPVSLDVGTSKNQTQTSFLSSPKSSSISSVHKSAPVYTSAPVEPTPTSENSKAEATVEPTSNSQTSIETTGTYSFSTAWETALLSVWSELESSSTSSSSAAPKSKSKSTLATITSASAVPTLPKSKSKSTLTTSTTTFAIPISTSTKSKLKPKKTQTSSTSSSIPTPTSSTSATADDENIPGPNHEIVGSKGEELETVKAERRGSQKAYIAAVQKLNTKHMNEVQRCKANITCVAASNREFATQLADLDYFA